MFRVLALLALGWMGAPLAQAGDVSFTWQARLLSALGTPIEGQHDVTLTLYDDGTPVWQKTWQDVDHDLGYAAIQVTGPDNTATELDDVDFNAALEVGVSIDGGPELSRQALGMVPRAAAASTAAAGGTGGSRTTAPITVYVRTDGDDTLCDGSADAPATSAPACAFASPQAAVDSVPDVIAHPVVVNIGPGTYHAPQGHTRAVLSVQKDTQEVADTSQPQILHIRQTPSTSGTVVLSGSPTDDIGDRQVSYGLVVTDSARVRVSDLTVRYTTAGSFYFARANARVDNAQGSDGNAWIQVIQSSDVVFYGPVNATGGGFVVRDSRVTSVGDVVLSDGSLRVERSTVNFQNVTLNGTGDIELTESAHATMSAVSINNGRLVGTDSEVLVNSTTTSNGITLTRSSGRFNGDVVVTHPGYYAIGCWDHSSCYFADDVTSTAALAYALAVFGQSRAVTTGVATLTSTASSAPFYTGENSYTQMLGGFHLTCGNAGSALSVTRGAHLNVVTYPGKNTLRTTTCAGVANISAGSGLHWESGGVLPSCSFAGSSVVVTRASDYDSSALCGTSAATCTQGSNCF